MGKQRKKKQWSKESFSFVITLISVSITFIFLGFLMGQYALQFFGQSAATSTVRNQQQNVGGTITSQLEESQREPPIAPRQLEEPEIINVQSSTGRLYRVQTGAFSQLQNAEAMVASLNQNGFEAVISAGPPYRVQTGAFASRENAENYADQLREKNFEVSIVQP